MNKVFITGTAGFIGFHLVEWLIKKGEWDIVGLDNINDYYDINLKYARLNESGIVKDKINYNKLVLSKKSKNYRFIKLDLTDKKNILKLFKTEKFEYVVNLAAQAGVRYSVENPYAYIDSNIYGFLNILEGCRHFQVKQVLYASSSSVYGANKKVPFSESDNVDHPISLYAATKKANELMAHTYSHLYKIPTTGVRFFTVYGPWGRPDMAYYRFAANIINNFPIDIYNFGKMKRDFTYIDDAISGIYKLLVNKYSDTDNYKIYNIGNNKPEELLFFIELIEKYLNKKAIKKFLPIQAGDMEETYADIVDLCNVSNFKPTTILSDGLKKFVDWYIHYMKIKN